MRREVLVDFEKFERASVPTDGWRALMEAAPGTDVQWALASEIVLDVAQRVLDEREKYIVNAVVFERVSLRDLGWRLSLSKTHVARLRDEAFEKIREAMA